MGFSNHQARGARKAQRRPGASIQEKIDAFARGDPGIPKM